LSERGVLSMTETALTWPDRWQAEAVDAVLPFVDTDFIVEIWVGDPSVSRDGSLLAGHLFTGEGGRPQIIFDRSGRPDVYSWRLLTGPVLRITARQKGKRRQAVYTHPDWSPA
jgi:hypothetical protein